MEGVNKAIPTDHHGVKTSCDPPIAKNESIYTRIADNLVHVNDMLNGDKAEEYGNPRTRTFPNDGSAATTRKWMSPS